MLLLLSPRSILYRPPGPSFQMTAAQTTHLILSQYSRSFSNAKTTILPCECMSLTLAYLAALLWAYSHLSQWSFWASLELHSFPFLGGGGLCVAGPLVDSTHLSTSHMHPVNFSYASCPLSLLRRLWSSDQVPSPDFPPPSYFFMGFASTTKYTLVYLFIVCCQSL